MPLVQLGRSIPALVLDLSFPLANLGRASKRFARGNDKLMGFSSSPPSPSIGSPSTSSGTGGLGAEGRLLAETMTKAEEHPETCSSLDYTVGGRVGGGGRPRCATLQLRSGPYCTVWR